MPRQLRQGWSDGGVSGLGRGLALISVTTAGIVSFAGSQSDADALVALVIAGFIWVPLAIWVNDRLDR